jgi:hypothetical protein|tara:strand:- start:271 stop:489 length:219 start_codon:yes stop_codon:yes gene_type:complete
MIIRLSDKRYIMADEKGSHIWVLRIRANLCSLLSFFTGKTKPYELRLLCWKWFGVPFVKYPKNYSKDFRKKL